MFMFLGLPVGIYSMLIEAKKEKYFWLYVNNKSTTLNPVTHPFFTFKIEVAS